MGALRIGLATQTPLLRLPPQDPVPAAGDGVGGASSASSASEASGGAEPPAHLSDFDLNPSGVSRMVLQSLRAWRRQGQVGPAHWFSLQPNGPPRLHLEDARIHVHHLRLPPDELDAYARTKERLWADIHGLGRAGGAGTTGAGVTAGTAVPPPFSVEDFRFYARYNGLASDAILAQVGDLDVAYVHDFQLLQVGAIVGLAAPCVLRWHVPFDPRRIPPYTRFFLLRMLEAYDGVVVSTRRELEGLTNAGFHGRVRQVYPHSDPADWAPPDRAVAQAFSDRLGLPDGAPVALLVARMDPMKRQDLAIEALARLRRRRPRLHLVLVGNGSFSARKDGGLRLPKADEWRAHLDALARQAGVADRVHFTGWLPDGQVAAAYARADLLVLPSDIEGFGLTPFEAWGHGKPCVVSAGCGCAEVVQDGVNGLVFPAGDAAALADALDRILGDAEGAVRMGEAGRLTLESHRPEPAATTEAEFLAEAVERYRRRA